MLHAWVDCISCSYSLEYVYCCVRCTVVLISHCVNLSTVSDTHVFIFIVCDVYCHSVWQLPVLLCICYVTCVGGRSCVGVMGFWCSRSRVWV